MASYTIHLFLASNGKTQCNYQLELTYKYRGQTEENFTFIEIFSWRAEAEWDVPVLTSAFSGWLGDRCLGDGSTLTDVHKRLLVLWEEHRLHHKTGLAVKRESGRRVEEEGGKVVEGGWKKVGRKREGRMEGARRVDRGMEGG